MAIFWGPDGRMLYNQAFLGLYPQVSLGAPGAAACPELWPDVERVLATRQADALHTPLGQEGVLTVLNDSAQWKRKAEALAELDRAKTAFFSNVSHELRTPLTLLLGPLRDLLDDRELPLEPEHREKVELALRNAKRLLKLVNAVLDFSRIEGGRVQTAEEPTELGAFTADVASLFRSAIEQAGLKLTVHCPPLPAPVLVDRDMWEKIVLNLISNAFKFTLQGEIEVQLWSSNGQVVLQVRDSGTGIPEKQLSHIFDRFYRAPSGRGRSREGTGIGLALVRELVHLHGGQIDVSSEVGVGTTFRVTIPGLESTCAPRPTGSSDNAVFIEEAMRWLPSLDLPPLLEGRRGPRVLLADDNVDLREYTARLLSVRYQVQTAGDGQEAWEAILEQPPDLVIADIMMPRLEGLELLRRMREHPRTTSIPVVLVSARAGGEARSLGLEAGADDYLVKPFHARELMARVSAVLDAALVNKRVQNELEHLLNESESLNRSLLESMPGVLYRVNAEPPHQVLFLSPGIRELTGYAAEDYTSGRRRLPLFDGHSLTAGCSFGFESTVHHRDGSIRNVMIRGRVLRDQAGQPLFLEGVTVDVTDSKRAEAAERAQLQAEAASKAKSEFLSNLSHELRTPLTGILGMSGLLAESRLAPQQQEFLQTINTCATVLMETITDVLDVSKIEAGKFELEHSAFELRRPFDQALALVRGQAQGKGLELCLEWDAALPTYTLGDAPRLRQILMNLLSNAVKFTEQGKVTLSAFSGPDDTVLVSVEDTGHGISEEDRGKLFRPFVQLHKSTRLQPGTGLGLAICAKIVQHMQGEIGVESVPGQGSRFWFRVKLPTAPEPPPDALAPAGKARDLNVLVAEDNPVSARVISLLLQHLGYSPDMVKDGLECLQAMEAKTYELVLMDCQMPRMDGFEATREIRRRWGAGPRIVALTAQAQPEQQARCRAAGMDDYCSKPIDLPRLSALLADAAQAPRP